MVVNWRERAGCIGLAPLFDDDEVSFSHIITCAGCPVRDECLAEGMRLTRERDFGVWGGLGRSQRQAVKMRRSSVDREWRSNLRAVGIGA
jgi:hypothetical protein